VWVTDEVRWLGEGLLGAWPGLAVVAVERSRLDLGAFGPPAGDGTGDRTPAAAAVERHYFVTSVAGTDARRMAEAVRGHWAVENKLHWQLDVSFREDERRIRVAHGVENFSRLCRLALNLLTRDTTVKAGV
jgi:predicted transposase YbfD/YdcC